MLPEKWFVDTGRFSGWRYGSGSGRDLRLDFLRGFAVFAMAVDHVGGESPLRILSGGNRFFVSAAEAFLFISGVTVGIVYSGRLGASGMRAVFGRAWGRAWTLYCVSVWLALVYAAAAAAAGTAHGAPFAADPARFVADVLTLQRSYYLAEVMLLYAFLMVLAPGAVFLLRRGFWPLVAGGSVSLWLAFQVSGASLVLPWQITDFQAFPLAAWQVLFFSGLLLGYYRSSLRRAAQHVWMPGFGFAAAGFGTLLWLHLTNAGALDRWLGSDGGARLLDSWFDKTTLPLPRLLAAAIVFWFAWQLVTISWRPLRATAGRALLPLGKSALYAYSAHVLASCAIEVAEQQWGAVPDGPAFSFGIQLALLAFLWAATSRHFLERPAKWLGRSPISMAGSGLGFRPAPTLFAAGLLLGASGFGMQSTGSATADAAERRAAYANPVTTVVPPRASLKPEMAPVSSALEATASGPEPIPTTTADISTEFGVLHGTLTEGVLWSEALGEWMPYSIYLPPSYGLESGRSYPVLYMLHGVAGSYIEWPGFGVAAITDEMMAGGKIGEMIVVFPEGGRGYWVDGLSGAGEEWTTYMVSDVVPFIDGKYRTMQKPASRAIGGISRGAYGALYLAFTHPEVWGVVGAHSPALPTVTGIESALVNATQYAVIDPVELARKLDPRQAPEIWIDAGDEDYWLPGARLLESVLTARGVAHEYSTAPGEHGSDYWIARAPEYMEFYEGALGAR